MNLTGANLIAGEDRRAGAATYRSVDPETGEAFGPDFHDATAEEVADAVAAATEAFATLRRVDRRRLAELLEGAAANLEALGDDLVEVAARETGLGTERITGERGRTCGQLRAFAKVAREGSHLDVRIDTADPSLTPPRPDLRRLQVPIGPVAVFGASNFPLAFSVPGGDTASALAAGCPVVAKAHPSHPATSELCGRAIIDAVRDAGLPAGTFGCSTAGRSPSPRRSCSRPASGRSGSPAPRPPGGRCTTSAPAGRSRSPSTRRWAASTRSSSPPAPPPSTAPRSPRGSSPRWPSGTGQFCTKPGVVLVPDDAAGRAFEEAVATAAGRVGAALLLNAGISSSLRERLDETTAAAGVEVLADGRAASDGPGFRAAPTVVAADLPTFRATPALREEHFGPVAVLVRVGGLDDMVAVARELPGALSASVHGTEADLADLAELLAEASELAGRILWNQFPTGVAVAPAMHHGGPYPATTFPAHTSVGTAAIRRFLRPVTYQNAPQALLPAPLRDENPEGLLRLVDDVLTDAPVEG
jgi:acyl-CoA reductase-like NAD-dependent aldehyde dehydrogenase